MKIVINEGQFESIISESKSHISQLCSHFNDKSKFCESVESVLKGRKKSIFNKSQEFFNKVIKDSGYFDVVTLEPGNRLYDERLSELIKFKDILEQYKSCPEIVNAVKKDIEILPKKGLKMNIDENNDYSIINRLNSHYTAQAYLLTKMIIDSLENEGFDTTRLINPSNEDVIKMIDHVLLEDYVVEVSENLSELLRNNEHFRKDLIGTLERSRELGNSVENEVFSKLRSTYGDENVFEFSGDFGFVDHFGVDGVVIINGVLHPIQISTSMKTPKLFKYDSENCKTRGYFKSGNKIIMYEPI
jgi:hypothetical protein